MMDIKPSSQPPQGDVLRFFRTTVDKMGPGDRECCADAFLRMVSDSPPGEPKSCYMAGARCPFELARPAKNASTIAESPGTASGKGIPTAICSPIRTGINSVKLIMISTALTGINSVKELVMAAFVVGLLIVIRFRLRRLIAGRGDGGGGAPAPAPTGTAVIGGVPPPQDARAEAMAWEVPYARLAAPGSD